MHDSGKTAAYTWAVYAAMYDQTAACRGILHIRKPFLCRSDAIAFCLSLLVPENTKAIALPAGLA